MPYLKPVLAGLLASAIVYLCFLTWLLEGCLSLVKEQGATGLIAVFSCFVTRRSPGCFGTPQNCEYSMPHFTATLCRSMA